MEKEHKHGNVSKYIYEMYEDISHMIYNLPPFEMVQLALDPTDKSDEFARRVVDKLHNDNVDYQKHIDSDEIYAKAQRWMQDVATTRALHLYQKDLLQRDIDEQNKKVDKKEGKG